MHKIGKVAEIAGISLKTLRHYDKIGLLKPKMKDFNGFRYYSYEDLLKLQQILFYKELDFSLNDIIQIYSSADFSPLESLKNQKILLSYKIKKFENLVNTIEKTINQIENKKENILMLSDEELYDGFTTEQAQEYKNEAINRWGNTVIESEMRIKKLGKDGWKNLKDNGEKITKSLAVLMDKYPEHPDVQDQIILWHDYINNFYDCTPEMLLELGKMYTEDKRFKNHYEKYKVGLAEFIYKAIQYYFDERIYLKKA
jgi:DNA-binding transcriptional MerR regulator